jgi:hypothetical protein
MRSRGTRFSATQPDRETDLGRQKGVRRMAAKKAKKKKAAKKSKKKK